MFRKTLRPGCMLLRAIRAAEPIPLPLSSSLTARYSMNSILSVHMV